MATSEINDLALSQMRRKACFLANEEKLLEMRNKKQGTRYRKWLYNMLCHSADHTYETEEAEYQSLGKWNRGIWHHVTKTFKTKGEMDFIATIAREYGAFDC